MSAFRDDAWPSKQRTGQPSELRDTVHWVNKSSSVPCLCPVGQFRDVCTILAVCMASALGLNTVTPPSKYKATQGIQPMLFQC